jgi:hypothetical protein
LTPWILALLTCASLAACADDDDSGGDDPAQSGTDDDAGHSDDDDAADDDDDAIAVDYPVVDTNQTRCYGEQAEIACASDFTGQDAQYDGYQPAYQDNGDGTVTDLITGLMWQQDPGDKMTYSEAVAGADSFSLAGHDDWRLPTIKELYSLMRFSGIDPSGYEETDTSGLIPFIDTDYFVFHYGDTAAGQRIIDSQWATSSGYGSTVMNGAECFFGVNFADGRIKCYPTSSPNGGYYAIYVRNAGAYAANDFADNGDGTVSDAATGLMWQQEDSGEGMVWEDALAYCEGLDLAAYEDWRLPNIKELQSIVDYSRSPDVTSSAAIDPVFAVTSITNEAGAADYPYYWTGTTHANWTAGVEGGNAAYVSFGRALGYFDGVWQDVHGAGAQRSDPKVGDPADYPEGHGPQGDAIRIYNYVCCVRDGGSSQPDASDDDGSSDDDDNDNDDNDDSTPPPPPDDDASPPPQDAVDACDGLQVGDPCEFTGQGGQTITGTCQMVGDVLACVP